MTVARRNRKINGRDVAPFATAVTSHVSGQMRTILGLVAVGRRGGVVLSVSQWSATVVVVATVVIVATVANLLLRIGRLVDTRLLAPLIGLRGLVWTGVCDGGRLKGGSRCRSINGGAIIRPSSIRSNFIFDGLKNRHDIR